jgi:hypothetical protein
MFTKRFYLVKTEMKAGKTNLKETKEIVWA